MPSAATSTRTTGTSHRFAPVLLRAGITTAIVDGLWACVLTLAYGRTIMRLWQGVASTPFGPSMFDGGVPTMLVGIGLHVVTAFTWSAVFLVAASRMSWLRRAIATPAGIAVVAAVYGPCIWAFMSLVVIPLLSHSPTAITARWFIQLAGHAVFVGPPIVWSVARGTR